MRGSFVTVESYTDALALYGAANPRVTGRLTKLM